MSVSGHVLVADDQPDVLEAMRMLLKAGGFAVETVTSPDAAAERVEQTRFDAVLIDLNYTRDTTSGIEGMDLLARLRSHSDVPVIVMTAWATLDLAIEAIRRGANDFIQKPWDNASVLNTVRAQIEKAQQRAKSESWNVYERQDARHMHDSLLRLDTPIFRGIEVAAWSKAALQVGGDYYQACATPDGRVLFCIADVCGKGISATIQMSNLQGALKASASETNPANLCRTLNRVLRDNLPCGRFVSLFVGLLEPESGHVSYCNAGHLPPALLKDGAVPEWLEAGGAVLGYFEDYPYAVGEAVLAPGDSIVLFTDGLTEARNPQGAEYGEDSLAAVLAGCSRKRVTEIRDEVVALANAHCGEKYDDDATVLVIQRAAA